MIIKNYVCLALLFLSGTCLSQELSTATEETDPVQVVRINGVKDPELKPYRQMLKGLDAFEENHSLAPSATLKFQLASDTGRVDFDDVTLTIAGGSTQLSLPVTADGVFTIPRIATAVEDDAVIVSNVKKGTLRWRGNIQSPGVPANSRRLGDLRLECEIGWAVVRQDIPFITRNSLSLLGGPCRSKVVAVRYQAPHPLASVTLVSGERKMQLEIDHEFKRVFLPPLSDTTLDDDSLIVFEFETIMAN